MHVLDFNRGVVHQDPDRKRQPPEGHQVDCLTQRAENGNGGKHRERNGCRDDDCATPGANKKQDHQRSQP